MLNLTEVLPSGWRRIEGWVVGSVAERLAQNVGGPVFHLQHYFKKKKKIQKDVLKHRKSFQGEMSHLREHSQF